MTNARSGVSRNRIVLFTTKNIRNGQEIFVRYGNEYRFDEDTVYDKVKICNNSPRGGVWRVIFLGLTLHATLHTSTFITFSFIHSIYDKERRQEWSITEGVEGDLEIPQENKMLFFLCQTKTYLELI